MTTEQLTEQQLNAFGNKLEQFGDSLSPIEQRLLAEILSMAASVPEDDVEGHILMENATLFSQIPHEAMVAFFHQFALQFTHNVHHLHAVAHTPGLLDPASHIPGLLDPGSHTPGQLDPGSHSSNLLDTGSRIMDSRATK